MTPRVFLMMLVLAAVWGASFLFMRVAVPALGPVVLADRAGRDRRGVAASCRARRAPADRPRCAARVRDWLLFGTVSAALPFALLAAAELEIEGVAGRGAQRDGAAVRRARRRGLARRALQRAARAGLVLGVAGVTLVVGLSPFTFDVAFVLAVLRCLAAASATASART